MELPNHQSISDPLREVVQKIILVSQPLPKYTLSLNIWEVACVSKQTLRVLKFRRFSWFSVYFGKIPHSALLPKRDPKYFAFSEVLASENLSEIKSRAFLALNHLIRASFFSQFRSEFYGVSQGTRVHKFCSGNVFKMRIVYAVVVWHLHLPKSSLHIKWA